MARLTPDVVHVQYQAAAFGMRPAIHALPWWLRATGAKAATAVTFHDLRVPYLFPKAGPARRAALRLLARGSRMVVATNAEDYAELGVEGQHGRLDLIPIGSNIPDAPPEGYDRAAWRAAAGIPAGAVVVAYFGFLNASKGGLTLLDALARLRAAGRDARLVMIGGAVGASDPTNAGYLAAFRAEAAAHGLDAAVAWTGHVAPGAVSGWLHAADVAALPYGDGASYRRGSLLAALAHGCAVVTTLPAPLTGAPAGAGRWRGGPAGAAGRRERAGGSGGRGRDRCRIGGAALGRRAGAGGALQVGGDRGAPSHALPLGAGGDGR